MNFKRTLSSLLLGATLLTAASPLTLANDRPDDWTWSNYTSDFTDIPKNAPLAERPWYYDFVYDMADKGYMYGSSDGSFNPDADLTWAEFASLIANGFLGNSTYETLQGNYSYWWEPYMQALADREMFDDTILENVPSSQWASYATANLNRYQVACVLSNLLVDRGLPRPNEVNYTRYLINLVDVDKDNPYAQQVGFVMQETVMHGYESQGVMVFGGEDTLTRAQAATVLRVLVYADRFVKSPETLKGVQAANS